MNYINKTPEIQVGIFSAEQICFTLKDAYLSESGTSIDAGKWTAHCSGDTLYLQNENKKMEFKNVLLLIPQNSFTSSFILQEVIIGVDFHWQRSEDQVFKGKLKLFIENGKVTVVNVLSVEDYLVSVISSEMKATASKEFLKAHAVISRSWLLAQLEKTRDLRRGSKKFESNSVSPDEIIRWYDREDHKNFDVCADDHCQRYQGITRASTPQVEEVIKETSGEVLAYNGNICDTRYYKCCGGVTELFENVWEPVSHPYLQKVVDVPSVSEKSGTNLEDEETAVKWILANPDSFCNTSDKQVLSQVLNDYDQETNDFFRWKVVYNQNELSDLVRMRTGIDFGIITDLSALKRGASGRIIRLRIKGTKRTMILGKELEIRKALSKSHLYSSCFIVEKIIGKEETKFIFYGAGWGHGVGLCQIGAAVMGSKGYSYREILAHYFRNAILEKRY
jgi:stage II sporulation protein D